MIRAIAIFLALGLLPPASDADARCRDAKGKVIACAAPVAAARCRDKTAMKFAKCSVPKTEPRLAAKT